MEFDYDEYQKAVYYRACQEVVLICLDLINLCDINEILDYKNYLEMLPHAIEIWKETRHGV
jgi:hypothetical protein